MRNFSILFAALVMTLAVSGCTTLLNTQAAAAAKDAENIARGCPAAAEKAAECRRAAQAMDTLQNNYLEFQSVGEDIAGVRRELADMQSQLDALDVQIANKNYRTDEDTARMQQEASDYDFDASQYQVPCDGLQDCQSRPAPRTNCHYNDEADCRHKAAQTRLALQNTPHLDDLNDQRGNIRRDMQRTEERLEMLRTEHLRLFKDITGNTVGAGGGLSEEGFDEWMANQAPSIVQNRMTELNETAQQARAEVQRIAAEQCGEGAALKDAPPKPSPPSGDYPQDILNSQSIGLPGPTPLPGPAPLVCPSSCAGITQTWCSIYCSAPVGTCAMCAFCAAQGCP